MTDLSAFYNRIKKNIAKHKGWVKSQNIEAYRAYEKDIPEYPYIVDIYKDKAVVYEQGKRLEEDSPLSIKHQEEIVEALKALGFKSQDIHMKVRERKAGTSQYEKLSEKDNYFIVRENQARFWINLDDYLDTGLFLDHRPARQKVFKLAKGKQFLNLFSYTGSVSVFAALGGAAKVTTVDMSNTYMNWAKQNFEINQIPEDDHLFYTQDVFKFLDDHHKKYDLIFLDPPTFSNSKKMDGTLDILRDHMDLVSRTMNLLKEDGLLIFSTNYRDFKIDESLVQEFDVKDITKDTIPQDFRSQKIHHCYEVRFKR